MENLVNGYIRNLPPKPATLRKDPQAIRLDHGELPYPPSPKVIKAISEAAAQVNRYPDGLADPVRDALADYNGINREQIIVGNGSDDLIELIVKVFVNHDEEVIIPIPTFFVYWRHATQILGGVPVFVDRTKDFGLDVKSIVEKASSPKTKVLFIANPNNPTANLVSREVLIDIIEHVNCMVVVDECYYELCGQTVADLVERYEHLLILRSLSKSFGLAGLRIGYGIAQPKVIDYLYRGAQTFPINRIAQTAAVAALQDLGYMHTKLDELHQERELVARELTALGLIVYPSETNFLFVRTESVGLSSKNLVEALCTKNVFVADFGLKQNLDAYYFKITVGTHEENQTLLKYLREAICP